MFNLKIIFFILFFIWGIPLGIFRSRFRKIVYKTSDWKINIYPYFIKETKALLSTMYPGDEQYIKTRNFYRFYLTVYTLLFIAYFWAR